jgi:poly(3-hydroxybutyrate) depolymerase
VTNAVAAVKSHGNIDPKRVILGGYSSGGDLAYCAAFENPEQFAGVLVANSSPFKDIGISQDAALATVANRWKFNEVLLPVIDHQGWHAP